MSRFSYRVLAASTLAAGLLGVFTSVGGCGTADCNDTATCPVGDDAFANPENAGETGDETLATNEGSPDAIDDLTADAPDSPLESGDAGEAGDVSAEAPDSDVDARDTVEAAPDVGVDMGLDVGIDVGRDVGIDSPQLKCVSMVLTPTNAIALSVNNANTASGAADGNFTTRWESAQGIDPEWVYVDFGSPVYVSRVRIIWETACGRNYDIQMSNDATTWTTVKAVMGNTMSSFGAPTDWSAAADHTAFTGVDVGRYLRVYGTARCTTNYGYSIWEMQVYGDPNPLCKP